MRKFKITEEQYNNALQEGVTLNADVAATNGDVKQAIYNTKKQARKDGVKMDDAKIQINASDTSESRVIKMKELRENRIRVLKENSQLFTFNDFIKGKSLQ